MQENIFNYVSKFVNMVTNKNFFKKIKVCDHVHKPNFCSFDQAPTYEKGAKVSKFVNMVTN